MKIWASFSRTPLALLTASLALGAVPSAMAADTAALTPEVLFTFGGSDADQAHWGSLPFTAPVLGNDGLLYGVTQSGGEVVIPGVVFAGLSYSYNPLTQDYNAVSMGILGAPGSALFKSNSGSIFGGVTYSGIDAGMFYGKGLVFSLSAEGASRFALPDSSATPSQDNLRPRGQIAEDNKGNMYVPVASATNNCADATQDGFNNLYRVSPAGIFERVINFCQFKQGGTTGTTQIHPYGSSPNTFVWDEASEYLYMVMAVSPSTAVEGVRPLAYLLRISGATLDKGVANNGVVEAGDIELLHTFALGNGGQPSTSDSRIGALLLDGDWIYGTSYYDGTDGNTSRGSGSVWRIHKTTGQFAVVHQFRAGAAADITTKTADEHDGTELADGFQPNGVLVVAADGNIYGTTNSDARTYTEITTGSAANLGRITPTGAGTLFRIKVGTASDRSDDTLEILHRFNSESEGKNPAGVSVGAIANGAQALYGVTRSGEGDLTNGALYQVAVPLTGEGTLELAASLDEAAAAGTSVSLSWSNPWYTQGCSIELVEGSDNLAALGAGDAHSLTDLLALAEPVEGISVEGDLASGSVSFSLTANASYQLTCPEPYAGYTGELLSQRASLTVAASSSSSETSSSSSSVSSITSSSEASSSSSSVSSSAASSGKKSSGGGSSSLLMLMLLAVAGLARGGYRKAT